MAELPCLLNTKVNGEIKVLSLATNLSTNDQIDRATLNPNSWLPQEVYLLEGRGNLEAAGKYLTGSFLIA